MKPTQETVEKTGNNREGTGGFIYYFPHHVKLHETEDLLH